MAEVPELEIEDRAMNKDPEKDFSLLEKLGEGSYGSVWKGMHRATGTIVAIKRVPIDNDLEEIMKEIEFMKQCRSPYIVRYYGSYFYNSELWIMMELCGAGSVADIMKICNKTLNEVQIATISRDVLKGLAYLHAQNKIHRDIKAGNILLNNQGDSKLADFGVSGQLSDTMAKRQTVIGTPFWMAPEVIQEVGYDYKADLWSYGITCIEMAEMNPPHSNIHPMRAIFLIPSRPAPKLTEQEKWSKEFHDFLAQCLIKNPDQRPTASQLLMHPFIVQKARSGGVLQTLIDEQERLIAAVGREAALGIEEKKDSGEDDESENEGSLKRTDSSDASNSTMVVNDGTMVVNDGTMVVNGSGTMVVSSEDDGAASTMRRSDASSGKKDYIPPYLEFIKNQQQQQQQQQQQPPQLNPKYANHSLEELKQLVEDLDLRKEREIAAIKEKYAQTKRTIMTALEEKKASRK